MSESLDSSCVTAVPLYFTSLQGHPLSGGVPDIISVLPADHDWLNAKLTDCLQQIATCNYY
jgi:hypothetical protein